MDPREQPTSIVIAGKVNFILNVSLYQKSIFSVGRRVPDRRSVGAFLLACWRILGDFDPQPESVIEVPGRRRDF